MLRISLSESKVARRILISFLLATLIPIGVLGYLSYYQVSGQLHEQVTVSLRNSCKDYAFGLLDRLFLYESALRPLAAYLEEVDKNDLAGLLKRKDASVELFASIALLENSRKTRQLLGDGKAIPDLTGKEIQEIQAGKTFIKPLDARLHELPIRFWMAVRVSRTNPQAGILLAELKNDLLWDEENNGPHTLWVLNEEGLPYFASEPALSLPGDLNNRMLAAPSGEIAWKNQSESYVGGYWKIPVISQFNVPPMTVVLARPESLAYDAMRQFSHIYPLVISFAILIVSLFSLMLIAKYVVPLQRLKEATQRIAEGDFSHRVDIDSDDEFEALAVSFNEMTQRIQGQFDVLSAMSEIDRHILSSINAEDIIETALSLLPRVIACDLTSIARIDPETYQVSDIRTRKKGRSTEILNKTVKFSVKEVLDLLAMQDSVIESGSSGKYSAYLDNFHVGADWRYLVVPVVVDGRLAAIICLGYQPASPILAESLNTARNFGDRIAVALSKAAWEEKLYRQAHYDTLTGLPNRLVLNERLTQEIARANRGAAAFAVIFIDLDRFKSVNDSLGHSAGDELLIQVARILVSCVRETDLVVRVGGDEFVIVITQLHHHADPLPLVGAIAEKILSNLKQTLVIADQPMTFTASLGIALYPKDADNVPDMLKNADAAMYHAKNQGRSNYQFYSSDINASALENLKLEHELRHAIAKGELAVFYQPKVDITGKIVGAEALIRWFHSELGMISPAKFIPIAEQSGLIIEIGAWVFEQTCLFVNYCETQRIEPVRISVNLSVIEFRQADLVDKLAGILSKTGVKSDFIELEITESVAIGEARSCIERMNELKKLGIKLSMDDFGTGFSSLSYLKDLPLNIIKVDQSFMRRVDSELSSQAIVKAILALANGLNMETVAEGVETESQVAFLKDHQCHIFQGFLFHKPMPGQDFKKLLIKT